MACRGWQVDIPRWPLRTGIPDELDLTTAICIDNLLKRARKVGVAWLPAVYTLRPGDLDFKGRRLSSKY
jgi:hypothetical protein